MRIFWKRRGSLRTNLRATPTHAIAGSTSLNLPIWINRGNDSNVSNRHNSKMKKKVAFQFLALSNSRFLSFFWPHKLWRFLVHLIIRYYIDMSCDVIIFRRVARRRFSTNFVAFFVSFGWTPYSLGPRINTSCLESTENETPLWI